jgi:hypothetical protein
MTVSLAISQSRYPSKAVLVGDTVVVTTMQQIRAANQLFLDRMECYEVWDTLAKEVQLYQEIVVNFEKQDSVRREEIENLLLENTKREMIAHGLDKQIALLEKQVKKQKQIVRLEGIGGVVLLILLILK